MPEDLWMHGAVVALVVSQLLVVWFLYRQSALAGSAAGRADPADGDTVVCAECGAPNGAEYQFCRDCTAELPGPSVTTGSVGEGRGSDLR